MRSFIAAGAAVVSSLACSGFAQITLVTDERVVRAEARVSSPNGTEEDGPFEQTPVSFGAPFTGSALAGAVVQGASAGASTVQISSITLDTINAQGSVSLSSTVGVGGTGSCAGVSLVDLLFDIPVQSAIQLSGSSTGVGFFELRTEAGDVIFHGPGVFHGVAGGRLRLIASADATLETPPSGSRGGGYAMTFRVVPSPGSAAAVVVLGVWAGTRRRRK